MKRFLLIFFLSGIVYSSCVFAETVRVESYYPVPYGTYERFRLKPQAGPMGPSCQIGTIYTNLPDIIRYCQDDGTNTGEWSFLPGVWRQGADGGGDPVVYLTDNDPDISVGIGTSTPSEKLEVNGFIEADNLSSKGTDNIFAGEGAGANNITGVGNVFVGKNAGRDNTDGSNNIFLGFEAGLVSNASNLVFIGRGAGKSNTEGQENTFVGYLAGQNNTTGDYNTFLGSYAGELNVSANANTFVGAYSGSHNTSGFENTFIGFESGEMNSTGQGNVMVGSTAGNTNTSGQSNTFVGYAAGLKNLDGSENVFLGDSAGSENTSGSRNVYLGSGSGGNNITGTDNVFIGYQAGSSEVGSNKLYIANSSANPPLIYGEFNNGRIGIGTTTPSYTLDVNGNVQAAAYFHSSDEKLKSNLVPIGRALEKIQRLRGLTFQWKESGKKDIGLIAQDVEKVFPELVVEELETGMKSVKYGNLVSVLIEAGKEQQKLLDVLEERINVLESRLESKIID